MLRLLPKTWAHCQGFRPSIQAKTPRHFGLSHLGQIGKRKDSCLYSKSKGGREASCLLWWQVFFTLLLNQFISLVNFLINILIFKCACYLDFKKYIFINMSIFLDKSIARKQLLFSNAKSMALKYIIYLIGFLIM